MQSKDIHGKTLSNSFETATSDISQYVKPRVIADLISARNLENVTALTMNKGYGYGTISRVYTANQPQSFTTPYNAAHVITGDIELVARVSLDDWTPATDSFIVSKWDFLAAGIRLAIQAGSGAIVLNTSPDAVNGISGVSANGPWINGRTYWIKVTLDVADGANRVYTFYYANDMDREPTASEWITLSQQITAGTTSIANPTIPIELGLYSGFLNNQYNLLGGNLYRFIMRNGINGNVVLDFDPLDAISESATSWRSKSPTNEIWTKNYSATLTLSPLKGRVSNPMDGYFVFNGAANTYISTPDSTALDITGDIELWALIQCSDWNNVPVGSNGGVLVSKYNPTGNQRSYSLSILPSGKLRFSYSTNGSTEINRDSTFAIDPDNADYFKSSDGFTWVGVRCNVANVANTHSVYFYYNSGFTPDVILGDQPDYEEISLGNTFPAGNIAFYNSNAPLTVGAHANGSNAFNGKIKRVLVRSGMSRTVQGSNTPIVVADLNVSNLPSPTANSWSSCSKNFETWTITGSPTLVYKYPEETVANTRSGYVSISSADPEISTPHKPDFTLTYPKTEYVLFDIKARVALDSWNSNTSQVIVAKYNKDLNNSKSYSLYIESGILKLAVSNNGSNESIKSATEILPFLNTFIKPTSAGKGITYWIRMLYEWYDTDIVNPGNSNTYVGFFWAEDSVSEPVFWNRVGKQIFETTINNKIYEGTDRITIGRTDRSVPASNIGTLSGKIYRVIINNLLEPYNRGKEFYKPSKKYKVIDFNPADTYAANINKYSQNYFWDSIDSKTNEEWVYDSSTAPAVFDQNGHDYERFFTPYDAINNVEYETFSWGVASSNDESGREITASGEFVAMPNDIVDNFKFGWWGGSQSGANLGIANIFNNYTDQNGLNIKFDNATINKIKIVTSSNYGAVKTFEIKVFSAASGLILNKTYTFDIQNKEFEKLINLDQIYTDINQIMIKAISTFYNYDIPRFVSINPYYQVDLSDYTTSMNVSRVRDLHETSLPIAGTSQTSADIAFDNTDKEFNPLSNSSTYGKFLDKDVKFTLAQGWKTLPKAPDEVSSFITANMADSAETYINLNNATYFPDGDIANTGLQSNYYLVTIDKNKNSEEKILVKKKVSNLQLEIAERGFAETTASAHTAGATIEFDPFEYVSLGTFYTEEISTGSSDMITSVRLQDPLKFLNDRTLDFGFFREQVTVPEAITDLLFIGNFPKKDIITFNRYSDYPATNLAVLQLKCDDESKNVNNSNAIGNGLRLRFYFPPDSSTGSLSDIKIDSLEIKLTELEKALGVSSKVEPTWTTFKNGINLTDYYLVTDYESTTGNTAGNSLSNYNYQGVFDGYYVPLETANTQFNLLTLYGGGYLYFNEELVAKNDFVEPYFTGSGNLNNVSQDSSFYYETTAGTPVKIRLEFWHTNYGSQQQYLCQLAKSTSIAEVISNASPTGNANANVTYTISSTPHTIQVGDYVTIANMSPSGYNRTNARVIASTSNTVTLTNANALSSNSTVGGNLTAIWTILGANEYVTNVLGDSIGSKKLNNSSSMTGYWRNDGVASNTVVLRNSSALPWNYNDSSIYLSNSHANGNVLSYVRIPYDVSLNLANTTRYPSGDWAMEVLFKAPNGAYGGQGEYISSFSNANSTTGFEFYYISSTNHGFKIKANANANITSNVNSNIAMPSSGNSWNHIIITYSKYVDTLYYYVNGVLNKSLNCNNAGFNFGTNTITIGGRNSGYTANIGPTLPTSSINASGINLYLDEFTIYRKHFTAEEASRRYIETQIKEIKKFPFLYAFKDSVFQAILNMSFADLGRLYIDETNKAIYEGYYSLFESSIDQHANVQKILADNDYIINTSLTKSVQINSVVIKVAGVSSKNNEYQSIWRAPDNTTLGVLKLTSAITDTSNTIPINGFSTVPFPRSGYIAIDDEIIKYSNIDSYNFLSVQRAQFNTNAAYHIANSKVREVRYYDFEFDKTPAYSVKDPFITGILFENPAEINILTWKHTPYKGNLIISASQDVAFDTVVFAEGTNPVTEEVAYTSIAGIPVQINENVGEVKEQKAVNSDNRRKYGLKEVIIESPFINDAVFAQELADFIISKLSEPIPIITVETILTPKLQVGDKIRLSSVDQLDISNADYWVTSIEMSIGQSYSQTLQLRKVV